MLQQTQVSRVIPKFEEFTKRFPDIHALATASLGEVLTLWSGLGYNRRAKFLWQAAQVIDGEHKGDVPSTKELLVTLPGIGPNTAGAILAYAYNQPVVFIETNIRTVYLHHFFADETEAVSDSQLRELAEQTLDYDQPREWYWALMDYGSFLKQTVGGRLAQSRHYKKQAPLIGSLREMRGKILKSLTASESDEATLRLAVGSDKRFEVAIQALQQEGMIQKVGESWRLTADRDDR
jgi:A/G-specific adenine glycosylase